MVAFKLTVPFIRTGARESSSWPGVHSTSRPNTFLQTTSANLEFFCLTPSGGPYIFYIPDKTSAEQCRKGTCRSSTNPHKAKLADQIALLRKWDLRWSATSVPTSLAVFWGEDVRRRLGADARRGGVAVGDLGNSVSPEQLLESLAAASDKLQTDFGSWKTPWGDINRFQRLTGDIVQPFNDAQPSIPVAFTSSAWDRSRLSERALIRARRNGTVPAETASSPW